MPTKTTNPVPVIRTPDALRGLDALYERVSQIVDRAILRSTRKPVHASVQKSA